MSDQELNDLNGEKDTKRIFYNKKELNQKGEKILLKWSIKSTQRESCQPGGMI